MTPSPSAAPGEALDDLPATPGRLRKLRRIVRFAGGLTLVTALVICAYEAYLVVEPTALLQGDVGFRLPAADAVTATQLAAAWAIQLVPVSLFVLAMLTARRLFQLWAGAEMFHPEAPRLLARLGRLSVASAVTAILARTGIALVLTFGLPAGQRQLVIGISSADVGGTVFGLLLFAVAMVMREAILIAQDNRGFV